MNKLSDLYLSKKYDTDKYDLGYFDLFYDEIFLSVKDKPINLLEIGIFRGGSIILWKDYLHKDSKIFGIDINACKQIQNLNNVTNIICDAYNKQNLSIFQEEFYDLIIDDGPHTYNSFSFLIQNYHSKLKKGGIMVIEDIIELSWTPQLISLAKKYDYSDIKIVNAGGKQKNKHLLNLWTKGLDVLILTK